MMAFALENFYTATALDDPRFFRFYAVHWTIEEGTWKSHFNLLNKCTDADHKKFYKYESETTKQKVETLKT